ncbi:serine/threonine-protein kinase [Aerosakkonema funiforme]|uniref:Tetratricopeptide repeat protein n=3 Tax=Oscillatoriophycideae TaxID=1301283 RepID=A0A926VBR2_9CYAN|nr:serine/threonine-protein kinase [Aerosakkonema funiforme]MBD2180760.1 tetratricopeptide repeat protein [Aerosakkonema funiforme FACHB-1375]
MLQDTNRMLGKTLRGRYQIIRLLGSGGFGATFVAEDRDLPGKPQCVVKQLKSKDVDPSLLQTARRLFETEAQVLYRLGKHDRIPQLLAHFEENQEFYLVQEFIEGEDLSQEITSGKQMNEAEVIAFLQDVLETLVFVHHQNVIHRDIKPSNIIRRRQDGKFVLIDFGAVKEITSLVITTQGQTGGTILIGSSGYMPNEQLGGKPRFNSDIYALGMTAIQALTGISPDELQSEAETGEVIWREQARVSKQLAAILDKMVRSHFRERYQSANEVLEDLRKLQSTLVGYTHYLMLPAFSQKSIVKYYEIYLVIITAVTTIFLTRLFQEAATINNHNSPRVMATLSAQKPEVVELLNQGKTLIELRRYDEAIGSLDKAIQIEPTYPEIWLERGKALLELQKFEEALRSFDEAVKLKSDYAPAWYCRGIVLEKLNRNTEALASLDKTVEIEQNYPEAWYIRGEILYKLQRYQEAVKSFDKAVKFQQNYVEAWYNIGIVLNKLQRHKEALSALEKAVQIQPAYPEAWVERGSTLGKLQKYNDAIASFDKALALNPNSAEAWYERGYVLEKLMLYEEALACLEKAIQIKQDYAQAWYNRGIVLEKLNKYDLAIASYDRAGQLQPDYSEAWYQKGIVLEKLQKYDEALAAYDKAIQIWPANQPAIENRKQLLTKLGR